MTTPETKCTNNKLFKNQILLDRDSRREESLEKLSNKRIWNICDVCLYTGYKKGTVYNLTSQDLIPYRKKRGKLFFIPHEIQNWIDEGDLL